LAAAAKHGGVYAAKTIMARLFDKPHSPFSYNHLGSLATIGRKAAVADFGPINMSGAMAWRFWGFIHNFFLVGDRNRLTVILNWLWSYFTFRASTRLITGTPEQN
jgi:NADH dehydrogenase FAD-containing subunit